MLLSLANYLIFNKLPREILWDELNVQYIFLFFFLTSPNDDSRNRKKKKKVFKARTRHEGWLSLCGFFSCDFLISLNSQMNATT